MKATVISLKHHDGEGKTERIRRVLELIRENPGSDLYLLPELWGVGFFSFEDYKNNAEDFYGETISVLSDAAKEMNAYIFTGSFIEKRSGKMYNTAALLDRHGNPCGKYSKMYLFGREKEYLTRGSEICVCDTEFGKTGLSICYDLRFPELYRAMTDRGAEMFLNCSAWPKSRAEHWQLLNRARALENQAAWLSCCASGENSGTEFAAKSYAVSPDGAVILETAAESETVVVNTDDTRKYRKEFPVLLDRL